MQKVIVALKEIYDLYKEPVSNEGLALLVRNLQHFDEAVLMAALEDLKFTRTSTFPLKFADFVIHVKKVLAHEYMSADDAWAEVIAQAPRGHRGYKNLSTLTQSAIDKVCGWEAIRTTDNLLYYRGAFIATYNKIIEELVECKLKP